MKEQILHLDPHDDFVSARDKMGWTQTARVLLVWPARGRVLARRLDLLLLHRHANRLGAHLALITADPVVRENARDLGLPVFDSIDASRRARWRSRTTRARPPRLYPRPDAQAVREAARRGQWKLPGWATWILRGLLFAAGAAGVLALALALVPGATVELVPAAHPLTVSVEVTANPAVAAVDGTMIPARVVRVEVEAEGHTATTGTRRVPSQPAIGSVVFTNLDGTATTIPQGTGVRTTSGTTIRFRTTRAVSIDGRIGATVAADIVAVDLGPAGNVGAGLINAIDGPLGLQLAVTNPAPTTGGALTEQASVAAADRERLRAELLARLQAEGLGTLESQLQPGEFLVHDSVAIAETVAQTFSLGVGEAADTLSLKLRIAVTGLAVTEADAVQVAQAALLASLPAGEALLPGQERYERDPATTMDADGRVHFTVTGRSAAVPLVSREIVREVVRGQPLPLARLRLSALLPLAETPEIDLFPTWFGRLPWMPFRIQVVINEAGA